MTLQSKDFYASELDEARHLANAWLGLHDPTVVSVETIMASNVAPAEGASAGIYRANPFFFPLHGSWYQFIRVWYDAAHEISDPPQLEAFLANSEPYQEARKPLEIVPRELCAQDLREDAF